MESFVDALCLDRYALYLQDFGGPVGFRLASRRPERVTALIVQNDVAHEVGLSAAMAPAYAYWADRNPETEGAMRGLLTLETTKFQYLTGAARHDPFFTPAGAEAYLTEVPAAELHFLDTGHFAPEEAAAAIAGLMPPFLGRVISPP